MFCVAISLSWVSLGVGLSRPFPYLLRTQRACIHKLTLLLPYREWTPQWSCGSSKTYPPVLLHVYYQTGGKNTILHEFCRQVHCNNNIILRVTEETDWTDHTDFICNHFLLNGVSATMPIADTWWQWTIFVLSSASQVLHGRTERSRTIEVTWMGMLLDCGKIHH